MSKELPTRMLITPQNENKSVLLHLPNSWPETSYPRTELRVVQLSEHLIKAMAAHDVGTLRAMGDLWGFFGSN